MVVTKVCLGITTHFFNKFLSEYRDRVKNKTIKNGGFVTEKPAIIFTELLRIIDEGTIDEERFKAMKSIFFFSAEKSATEKQEQLAYQLLQTAIDLSSPEILILSANYQLVSENTILGIQKEKVLEQDGLRYWAEVVAEKIGHDLPELVLKYEKHLIGLQIISGYHHVVDTTRIANTFERTPYFRLTPLGYKLAELISKYE